MVAASQRFCVSPRTVGLVTRCVPVRYDGAKSTSFMFKTLVKIASHEPYKILISSTTSLIVILRLVSTIAPIFSTFSSAMDVLGGSIEQIRPFRDIFLRSFDSLRWTKKCLNLNELDGVR